MTRRDRNNLLICIVASCGMLTLPLLGVAIGFGVCGSYAAMRCIAWVVVALVLTGAICAVNVREVKR